MQWRTTRRVYRFVLQHSSTAPVASDYAAGLGRHVSTVIGDLLRAAGHDAGLAEPWGFAMVGAVRSAAERWLAEPTLSRDALASYLTDLLWAGSRSAPLPPAPNTRSSGRPTAADKV